MKPLFIVNNYNKARYVARAVAGALAQTHPCHVVVSDYQSTDNSVAEIERALAKSPRGAEHEVTLLRCDLEPPKSTQRSMNAHLAWILRQVPDGEWIFQCSSDDYSLPDRVRVCMQAIKEHPCVAVGTTMRFEAPGKPEDGAVSGYPTESGYVSAGLGLHKMAYGSCIWGYKRVWLEKIGLDVPCTIDVYLGSLASFGEGAYVVANPQHVHFMAEDLDNMGFQGKMRAAEASGDKETIARINELNRFQLFELYFLAKIRQQQLYPLAHKADQDALINMILAQAAGWYAERANLHAKGITPGVIPS